MRYFMRLSYLGAGFAGWQVQPGQPTVQGELERALSTILRQSVAVVGAGRTDTGVNARMMVAHFEADGKLPEGLVRGLNSLLDSRIAVQDIYPCELHARFDATQRTYHYYAIDHKSPFFCRLAWRAPVGLDYDAMTRAARLLLDTDDFTSFSKLHTQVKTNICHVTEAEWRDVPGGGKVFVISADRFLRNMVRAVVGTLVEVGRGKMDIDGFSRVIAAKDRCVAGTSMPAHALYLWDIKYD